jgi:ubiquitin-protein ligase
MESKRAAADYAELQKPIYAEARIFYSANETNIKQGYACVFGPEGSPYEDCPMLYSVDFGPSYPFDPPKVQFLTYDGHTRFHPNMYKEGKVCLSILHTWDGPKWASTMRLSTIFLTLQSIMDSKPLMHEPGYAAGLGHIHHDYAQWVEYSCMRYIVARATSLQNGNSQPEPFQPFVETFKKLLPGILERLEKRLRNKLVETEGKERVYSALPYSMGGTTTYKKLLDAVVALRAHA